MYSTWYGVADQPVALPLAPPCTGRRSRPSLPDAASTYCSICARVRPLRIELVARRHRLGADERTVLVEQVPAAAHDHAAAASARRRRSICRAPARRDRSAASRRRPAAGDASTSLSTICRSLRARGRRVERHLDRLPLREPLLHGQSPRPIADRGHRCRRQHHRSLHVSIVADSPRAASSLLSLKRWTAGLRRRAV